MLVFLLAILAPVAVSAHSLETIVRDRSFEDELGSRYHSISDRYEERRRWSLGTAADQYRYESDNRALADWASRKLLQLETDRMLRKVPEDTATGKTVHAAAQATQAIRSSTVALSPETKARLGYDLPSSTVTGGLRGAFGNTEAHFRAGSQKIDVSAEPSLAPLGVSSNAHYDFGDDRLSYGVCRSLVGPLSTAINQSHHLREPASDETTYSLRLGFGL